MNKKKQIQITLPNDVSENIRTAAQKCGITPNVFIRIQLCQINRLPNRGDDSREYIIKMENWREVEGYAKERGFGGLGIFLNKAAEWYMKKFHLSDAQKAAIDKNIEKWKETPAYASATAL
jgi:hypothetical protein